MNRRAFLSRAVATAAAATTLRRATFAASPTIRRTAGPRCSTDGICAGWKPRDADKPNGWRSSTASYVNTPPSTDILTERSFDDFDLHVEFKPEERTNSGPLPSRHLRGPDPEQPRQADRATTCAVPVPASRAEGRTRASPSAVADVRRDARRPPSHRRPQRGPPPRGVDVGPLGTGNAGKRPDAPVPLRLQGDHQAVSFRKSTFVRTACGCPIGQSPRCSSLPSRPGVLSHASMVIPCPVASSPQSLRLRAVPPPHRPPTPRRRRRRNRVRLSPPARDPRGGPARRRAREPPLEPTPPAGVKEGERLDPRASDDGGGRASGGLGDQRARRAADAAHAAAPAAHAHHAREVPGDRLPRARA